MANELQFRSTVVAIKKEVTQNTIVAPTAATNFLPILGDFDVSASFDVITSEEVLNSIGEPKPTLGFENPTAAISLYLKHSGVEGQAPNWAPLLESLLGATSTAAAEYNTIAASTTSLVKVDVGEGASYERGEALLVKDGTNGYAIRNIASITGDDLTLAQNLAFAPAVGVNLGKSLLYKPANTGHPSLTVWDYHSNGGAKQVVGGARVVSMAASIAAGGAIQGNFSLEGVEFYFDPFIISATNKFIDFNDGGVKVASVPVGTYKDPYSLAAAIQTAMDSISSDTIICVYSDVTRMFTIASNGIAFSILWLTGANTANAIHTTIGFSAAADDAAALTYTSDVAVTFTAPFTPTYDSVDINVAKDNQVLLGAAGDISCFRAKTLNINVGHDHTKVDDICATSGRSGSLFTKRTVTIDVVSYLELGQAEEFKKFRANDAVIFTFNFGKKVGGNWLPGTVGNIHMPTATISSFKIGNDGGIVTLEMQLKGYVSGGLDEIYFNWL